MAGASCPSGASRPAAKWAGGRHSSFLTAAASGCAPAAYLLGHGWAVFAISKSATHLSFPCNGPAGSRDQGEGEREEANRGKGQRALGKRGDTAGAVAREGCRGKEDRA